MPAVYNHGVKTGLNLWQFSDQTKFSHLGLGRVRVSGKGGESLRRIGLSCLELGMVVARYYWWRFEMEFGSYYRRL